MTKGLLMGCVMVAAVALMSSAATADVFHTTKVKRATAKPNGTTAIMLVRPSTNECCTTANCWYTAPSGSEDEALAVALTAISLGSDVRVGLSTDTGPGGASCVITEIGIENPN